MEIDTEKTALRRLVRARRDAMDARAREQKSARICDALVREVLGMQPATSPAGRHRPTVAVYAAFGSEANPAAFAHAAEQAGWCVAYPRLLPQDEVATLGQRMDMRGVPWSMRDDAPFLAHPARAYAAHEVDEQRFPIVPASELDAVIVPLVAFDDNNNRLGYGGGCYDRYLPTLRPDCRVIGIAFAEQRVECVPIDRHDRALPRIVGV